MKIFAPAKINLFLHVLRKRKDHYHDIFSLMCPLSLGDKINLKFGNPGIKIYCQHPDVPEDKNNLAFMAAQLFYKTASIKPELVIEIEKIIPVAAGLGGGSSDAAAILTALNHYYEEPLSLQELMELGLSVGADLPFFILGKPALAGGIGEKLTLYQGLYAWQVILLCPHIKIFTKEIYKNLNLGLTKCKNKYIKALLNMEIEFDIKNHLCNDLEMVTASRHPGINQAKQELLELGADGVLMSGSGPSVFGLFKNKTSEQMEKFYKRLKNKFQGRVLVTGLVVD